MLPAAKDTPDPNSQSRFFYGRLSACAQVETAKEKAPSSA
jgi:hypothetical protein